MPKQIKQMKISQPQNQGKAHTEGGVENKGEGATNAVLNRHQLGIKLLFSFFGIAVAVFDSRLGSMTTFFSSFFPSLSGQMGASLDPARRSRAF